MEGKFALLRGEKVRLRALEPEDVDLLYGWENDPRVWSVSGTLAPFSRETLREFIDNQRFDIFRTRQLRLVICKVGPATEGGLIRSVRATNASNAGFTVGDDSPTGRPVGFIDLFDFEPIHSRAGVGILICDEADRRHGYAAEALELVTDYVSVVLGLHQLYAGVESDNAASIELFTRAGFSQAGVRRDWVCRRSENRAVSWCNEIIFQKIL